MPFGVQSWTIEQKFNLSHCNSLTVIPWGVEANQEIKPMKPDLAFDNILRALALGVLFFDDIGELHLD